MARTLGEAVEDRAAPAIAAALGVLAEAAAALAARLAGSGPLPDAEPMIAAWLAGSGIRWMSVPGGGVAETGRQGELAVTLDPMQGNPGSGLAAGTIFSLRPAAAGDPEASFLTPGKDILAAGAVLYGPRTRLVLALGGVVQGFTLNPASAAFHLTDPALRIPDEAHHLAADAARARHWDRPVRLYLQDCFAGAEGPRAADHDLRWSGCLAAELHRILGQGGLLLVPRGAPDLPGLIHQAQPLAFIAEAAGGSATDGQYPVLERVPAALDAASPLALGSAAPVARVAAYHDLPDSEVSPLFGKRGLFRL